MNSENGAHIVAPESTEYKLYKKSPGISERVITVWNELSPLILAQLLVSKVVF